MGALALAASLVLRRREPEAPAPARGDLPPAAAGPSRAGTIGALAGAALGAVALLFAVFVAEREARAHGFFHLTFGLVILGLFIAIDRWWRPREGTAGSWLRLPMLVLLWVGLAGAFLESMGAAGYGSTRDRIPWLTTVHGIATPFGALGLVMIPVGLFVLASVFVERLHARRTATS